MKLGLHIYDYTWPGGASQLGPTLVKIAQAADAWGFDRISVMDHVWQSHYLGGPEREVLSCYPTLTFLAAHTGRIRLIAMATAAPYWQPVLLAKTVTTLDVLSGGRAWLGIGAGDYEEEAVGSGLPFPPLKERYERLEEEKQRIHYIVNRLAQQTMTGSVSAHWLLSLDSISYAGLGAELDDDAEKLHLSAAACESHHQSVANYPTVDLADLQAMIQDLTELFGLMLPENFRR